MDHHRLQVLWCGKRVGTLLVPRSFRQPMTDDEMQAIPAQLIGRSTSFLFDIRDGDLRLAMDDDEMVVAVHATVMPGDIASLDGFHSDDPAFQRDPGEVEIERQVMKRMETEDAAR